MISLHHRSNIVDLAQTDLHGVTDLIVPNFLIVFRHSQLLAMVELEPP